jgi:hypothetical protein
MPHSTFAEAWAQHDAAEKACLSFGQGKGSSSANGRKAKAASSQKIPR